MSSNVPHHATNVPSLSIVGYVQNDRRVRSLLEHSILYVMPTLAYDNTVPATDADDCDAAAHMFGEHHDNDDEVGVES